MTHRFSALLVQDRVVYIRDMDAALRRQRELGGRLGTNLLEVASVDESLLCYALGQVVGLPPAEPELFVDVDRKVAAAVPVGELREAGVLPLRERGGWIEALVTGPLAPEVRERFEDEFGAALKAFVTLEFRFFQVLSEVTGEPLPERFADLVARFPSSVTFRGDERASGEADGSAGEDQPAKGDFDGSRPPTTGKRRILKRGPEVSTAETLDLRLAIEAVEGAESREAFVDALLTASNSAFIRVAVVARRGSELRVLAFRSRERGDMEGGLAITLPAEEGALARCFAGKGWFTGVPDQMGVEGLYRDLELEAPVESALMPVPVRGRVALVVVGDHGAERVDARALPPLLLFYRRAGDALARLVVAERAAAQDAAEREREGGPGEENEAAATAGSDATPEMDAAPTSEDPQPEQPAALDDVAARDDTATEAAAVEEPAEPEPDAAAHPGDGDEPGESAVEGPSDEDEEAETAKMSVVAREEAWGQATPGSEDQVAGEQREDEGRPAEPALADPERRAVDTQTPEGGAADAGDGPEALGEAPEPAVSGADSSTADDGDADAGESATAGVAADASPAPAESEPARDDAWDFDVAAIDPVMTDPKRPLTRPVRVTGGHAVVLTGAPSADADANPGEAPTDAGAPSTGSGDPVFRPSRSSRPGRSAPTSLFAPIDEAGSEAAPAEGQAADTVRSEAVGADPSLEQASEPPVTEAGQGPDQDAEVAGEPTDSAEPAPAEGEGADASADEGKPDEGAELPDAMTFRRPGQPRVKGRSATLVVQDAGQTEEAADADANPPLSDPGAHEQAGSAHAAALAEAAARDSGWTDSGQAEAARTGSTLSLSGASIAEAAAKAADDSTSASTSAEKDSPRTGSTLSLSEAAIAEAAAKAADDSTSASTSAEKDSPRTGSTLSLSEAAIAEAAWKSGGAGGASAAVEGSSTSRTGSTLSLSEAAVAEAANPGPVTGKIIQARKSVELHPEFAAEAARVETPATVPKTESSQGAGPHHFRTAEIRGGDDPRGTVSLSRDVPVEDPAVLARPVHDLDLDDPDVDFAANESVATSVRETELDSLVDALNLRQPGVELKLEQLLERLGSDLWVSRILRHFPGRLVLDRHAPLDAMRPIADHGPLVRFVHARIDIFGTGLVDVLSHGSDEARYYAFRLLCDHLDARTRARYARTLVFDSDTPLRTFALRILEDLRGTRAFDLLLDWLRSNALEGPPREQELALSALLHFRDEGAVPTLIRLLTHRSGRIQRRAHQLLCRLTCMAFDADEQLWQRWYAQYGHEGRVGWILGAMAHSSQRVRENVARELRELPGLQVDYRPDLDRREQLLAQRIVQHYFQRQQSVRTGS